MANQHLTTKKKLLIIGVFFAIISLAYISNFSSHQSRPTPLPVLPTPTPQPPPQITFGPIKQKPASIPNSLPLYTYSSQPLSSSQVTAIAQAFGFTSQPKTAKDVFSGDAHIWSDSTKSLVIKPQVRNISYIDSQENSSTGQFNTQQIESTSQKLISSLNSITGLTLQLGDLRYYQLITDEKSILSEPAQANLAKAEVNYHINRIPVVGMSNVTTYPTLNFFSGNILASFNLILPPTQIDTTSELSLLELSSITSEISQQLQPFRISYGQPMDVEADPPSGFFDTNSAQLVYYLSPHENKIFPIYLFDTMGKSASKDFDINALYYIPAYKE